MKYNYKEEKANPEYALILQVLKAQKKKQKLRFIDIADAMQPKTSSFAVMKWFGGQRTMLLPTILQVCKILDLSKEELFENVEKLKIIN